jgi:hypothetical protein
MECGHRHHGHLYNSHGRQSAAAARTPSCAQATVGLQRQGHWPGTSLPKALLRAPISKPRPVGAGRSSWQLDQHQLWAQAAPLPSALWSPPARHACLALSNSSFRASINSLLLSDHGCLGPSAAHRFPCHKSSCAEARSPYTLSVAAQNCPTRDDASRY